MKLQDAQFGTNKKKMQENISGLNFPSLIQSLLFGMPKSLFILSKPPMEGRGVLLEMFLPFFANMS